MKISSYNSRDFDFPRHKFVSELKQSTKRQQKLERGLLVGRISCFLCFMFWCIVLLYLLTLSPNDVASDHSTIIQHSKSVPFPVTGYSKIIAGTEDSRKVTPISRSRSSIFQLFRPGLQHSPIYDSEPYIAPEISENSSWAYHFYVKAHCVKTYREGVIYLYHMRKAAGSSLRAALQQISRLYRVQFLETEGLTLDKSVLAEKITSSVVIRNPIDRILSLYWYEHVDYYFTVKKTPRNCSTFSRWIDAWIDGSQFKANTLKKYPDANYIEIENYYVKSLIGWSYSSKSPITVGMKEYKLACNMLQKFDIVLLTEWMKPKNQSEFLNMLHPRGWMFVGNAVKGKDILRMKYSHILMPDKVY